MKHARLLLSVVFAALFVVLRPVRPQKTASVTAPALQDQKRPIIYVKHLVPPLRYPQLARQAQFQGTVVIELRISADGNVIDAKSIDSSEDPRAHAGPFLKSETEKLVRLWTFGCANCSPGEPYEAKTAFVYRLEGEPILYDDSKVSMDLPDEVVITASPIQCDHCPGPKTSKKGKH